MKKTKQQHAELDFKKYLLLQKQFNILNGELLESISLDDLLDQLDLICCEHSSEDSEKITSLFKELKSMINESHNEIVRESRQYLTNKKLKKWS